MTKRLSIATAVLTVLAALLALLLVAATPALAHHSDDHAKGGGKSASQGSDHEGDADSDSDTAYTEDNDTNDGGTPNNVPDEGDNRHPSGKDRSVENGNLGNQGKSESNPDDSKGPMRYEGELGDDKPNGPGGTDLADQDGNNGCGNDDDFDDDNNGWCGKPKDEETEVAPLVAPPVVPPAGPDADVLGEIISRGPGTTGAPTTVAPTTVAPTTVAATTVAATTVAATRAASGAVLPFTGSNVVVLLIIALGLLGVGVALLRTRRN